MMYLINIQYNIIILIAREGNMGNCHASVDIGFLGVTIFPMLPSRAVNIDIMVFLTAVPTPM